MLNRRAFLSGAISTALAIPLAVEAQQAAKIYRIGYLALNSPPNPFYEAFISGLRELGYADGQNIVIESRWAAGHSERLPALAAELVHLRTDVIVTAAQAATIAARQATATIPIVMVNVKDPDREGFIASFARPGGNITGVSYTVSKEQRGKLLELIREAVPGLARAAVLINAAYPLLAAEKQLMEDVARPLNIELQWMAVQGPNEFEKGFIALTRGRADAVVVFGDPVIFVHRKRIISLAERHRVPAMYTDRVSVEDGGLISYASDTKDTYRRSAVYVDKILKGAKPADLPVEQPTKLELVINLKTARALGLSIPPSLLLRADQVIE